MKDCWLDQNNKCITKPPKGHYGFVYMITNVLDGRIYIGKKAFSYKKKTSLSKKARKTTRKRVKIEQVDSQWLSYYGSSIDLKADVKKLGSQNFTRRILHLCESKTQMNYLEAKEQFAHEVLEIGEKSYNKWIGIKSFKSKFIANGK